MSLITAHWSATSPVRLRTYHVEFAYTGALSPAVVTACLAAQAPADVDWDSLARAFAIWKNMDFSAATDYGTWHINHDPRDNSPNIEVAAMCMQGASVSGPWGPYPYEKVHAWMHAAIIARIGMLKDIPLDAFFDNPNPDVYQNAPLYVVSTHAERAYQSVDPDAKAIPSYGDFVYGGDGDCRFDCAALDPSAAHVLASPDSALSSMRSSAQWLRQRAHLIALGKPKDMWGLNQDAT